MCDLEGKLAKAQIAYVMIGTTSCGVYLPQNDPTEFIFRFWSLACKILNCAASERT